MSILQRICTNDNLKEMKVSQNTWLDKILKIIDCAYWVFTMIGWIFRGLSEVANALGGLIRQFTDKDDGE
jgi:hypothetical protein